MGWSTYQCHFSALVLLCILKFCHVTATPAVTSRQMLLETTKEHNTTINPIVEVKKINYFKTAFRHSTGETSTETVHDNPEYSNLNKTTTIMNKLIVSNTHVNSDYSTNNKTTKVVKSLSPDQDSNIHFDFVKLNKTTIAATNFTSAQNDINLDDLNTNETINKLNNLLTDENTNFYDSSSSEVTRVVNIHKDSDKTYTVDFNNNDNTNTIAQSTDVLYESTSSNFINHNDIISKIATQFNNIIPQFPSIHQVPFEMPMTTETIETTLESPITENLTTLLMDSGTNKNDNPTGTSRTSTQSHVNHKLLSEVRSHDYTYQDTYETPSTYTQPLEKTYVNRSSEASDVLPPPRYKPDKDLITDNKNDNYLNDIFLEISLTSSGDSLVVNWLFATNYTQISGFQVSYRMNDREDFDSSSLGISARSFTLHSLHEDENYVICVHAIVNNTLVKNSCEEWSKSSMKIVVGIMAGVIFLVPFVSIIICILYKDNKMKRKIEFHKLNEDSNLCDDNLIYFRKSKDSGCHEHSENGIKIIYGNLENNAGSSCKSSSHENFCEHAAEETTNDEDMNGPWKRLNNEEVEEKACASNDELLPDTSVTTVYKSNKVGKKASSNSSDRLSRHSNQREMTSSLHEII